MPPVDAQQPGQTRRRSGMLRTRAMNYRHHFHAGGPADVFKHLVLVVLLRALQRKPGGLCYVDTHAGTGSYNLDNQMSQRTGEFARGIARLWGAVDLPEPLAALVTAIASVNPPGALQRYPGSPQLARALLRAHDRMIACELHPDDAASLARLFRGDPQVAVHHRDGYAALKAFVPPKERRGLVLIDPPFERPDEFNALLAALQTAHQRWPSGCYALWYPIKATGAAAKFHGALLHTQIRRVLCVELYPRLRTAQTSLAGSGVIIVNPPWQSDVVLRATLPTLATHLADDDADLHPDEALLRARVEWLIGE